MTMVDAIAPTAWRRSRPTRLATDTLLVLAGSLLAALSAQVAVPLPFTSVPVTGRLAERGWDRRPLTAAAAMAAGIAVIYLVGVSWLSVLAGPDRMLAAGLVPFLPGDLLKIALASAALPGGWRLACAWKRSTHRSPDGSIEPEG